MISYIAVGVVFFVLGYVCAYLVIHYIDRREHWGDDPNDDPGDDLGPPGRVILAGQRMSDDELPQLATLLEQEPLPPLQPFPEPFRVTPMGPGLVPGDEIEIGDPRLFPVPNQARMAAKIKLGDHLARAMCLPHPVPEHLNPNKTTRQGGAISPFEGPEDPTKGKL